MDDVVTKPYRLRQDVRTLTMGLGACCTAGLYYLLAQRALDPSVLRRAVFASASGWWALSFLLPRLARRRKRAEPSRAAAPREAKEEAPTLADLAPAPIAPAFAEDYLHDPAVRLQAWPSFRGELPLLLEGLSAGECFLFGKVHFVAGASAARIARELSTELGFAGEYHQSLYNARTLAYALRVRGNEGLLHGTFSPVRHLVESGCLAPGSFEASLLVIKPGADQTSAGALVEFLDLDADPLLLGQYAKGAAAGHVPHLFLTEGFPEPRTMAFTLLQLLYLDGNRLQAATEPAVAVAPKKAKRKPRKRPARRTLGRLPALPPVPPEQFS